MGLVALGVHRLILGVINDELSPAVVAHIRVAGLAWAHRSLDSAAAAMGAEEACR